MATPHANLTRAAEELKVPPPCPSSCPSFSFSFSFSCSSSSSSSSPLFLLDLVCCSSESKLSPPYPWGASSPTSPGDSSFSCELQGPSCTFQRSSQRSRVFGCCCRFCQRPGPNYFPACPPLLLRLLLPLFSPHYSLLYFVSPLPPLSALVDLSQYSSLAQLKH
eukprot:754901-Hanusia_phi.AAC.3